MKQQILSEEFRRMQVLAGIITESEYKQNIIKETPNNIDQDKINAALAKVTKIPVDKVEDIISNNGNSTEKEEVKEGLSLVVTIALLVPTFLELAGEGINMAKRAWDTSISSQDKIELEKIENEIKILKDKKKNLDNKRFGLSKPEFEIEKQIKDLEHEKDEKFGSKVGNWMKSAGHDLHKAYTVPILLFLEGLATIQRWTGFGKKSLFQDREYRQKIANIIYFVCMVFIAGTGVVGSVNHLVGVKEVATLVLDSFKGGMSLKETAKAALELI